MIPRRVIWSVKKDFYETHFPSNTTQSAGENVYSGHADDRLTTAYSQNEVNYYMAAAIFASIATVGKGWYNSILHRKLRWFFTIFYLSVLYKRSVFR